MKSIRVKPSLSSVDEVSISPSNIEVTINKLKITLTPTEANVSILVLYENTRIVERSISLDLAKSYVQDPYNFVLLVSCHDLCMQQPIQLYREVLATLTDNLSALQRIFQKV